MSRPGAYSPYQPAARPGEAPSEAPRFRVLVHRKFYRLWLALPDRVGIESAQQFYDHVAYAADRPPDINTSCILRGKAGKPVGEGFSRTIHYEVSGAGRINYQYNQTYTGGAYGDPHPVVFILSINLSSH